MRVDPDALAEALAEWSHSYESLEPVLAAARAFLEAPTADFCWTHHASVVEQLGGCGKYEPEACVRVGRVRLVAEEEK